MFANFKFNMDVRDIEEYLNSVNSVEELDQWANQHNRRECPAVNLRRIELLLQGITPQTGRSGGSVQVSFIM